MKSRLLFSPCLKRQPAVAARLPAGCRSTSTPDDTLRKEATPPFLSLVEEAAGGCGTTSSWLQKLTAVQLSQGGIFDGRMGSTDKEIPASYHTHCPTVRHPITETRFCSAVGTPRTSSAGHPPECVGIGQESSDTDYASLRCRRQHRLRHQRVSWCRARAARDDAT